MRLQDLIKRIVTEVNSTVQSALQNINLGGSLTQIANTTHGIGARATKELSALQDSFGRVGTAALAPLAQVNQSIHGINNSLSSLGSSSAPTAFRTLSGHVQILSLSFGQFLQPALAMVSVNLYKLSTWLQSLDSDFVKSVSSVVTWVVGIGTVSLALGRLTSAARLLIEPLMALRLLNPFTALAAGALYFASQGKLTEIAATLQASLLPVLEAVGTAGAGLAQSLAGPLSAAIQGLAKLLEGFFSVLSGIGSAFGISSEGMGGMIIVAVVLRSTLTSLFAQMMASSTAYAAITTLTNAMTSAFRISATAAWALSASLVATGIGAIVIALTAGTSALLSFGGAFGTVGNAVEEASKKIQELQGILDKLSQGGKLKESDLKKALNPGEYKKFVEAKTPEERKKVLGEAKARQDKEVEAGKNPETGRKLQARLEDKLSAKIDTKVGGTTSPKTAAEARFKQIRETAIESGASQEQAEELVKKIRESFQAKWYEFDAGGPLAGEKKADDAIDPKTIEGIGKIIEESFSSAANSSKIIAEAMKNGVGTTKLGALQGLKAQFPHAFHKEMSAQQLNFADVRGNFQNAMNNKDPLELEILKQQRIEAQEHTAAVINEIRKINEALGGRP